MFTSRIRRLTPLFAMLLLCLTGAFAQSGERILDYHSDITVRPDREVEVRETIKAQSAGDRIQHGIYREFPTRYRDIWGNRSNVEFTILDVQRDGRPEPYSTENVGNGVRVKIGDPNSTLPPGIYTYSISYRVSNELGFFKDHDELYWNVTGNGWEFPTDNASATVTLPAGIPREKIDVTGYTGPKRSKAKNLTASVDANSVAHFATTTPLNEYEGLTIVASFPKGIIPPPPGGTFADFASGRGGLTLVALVLLLLVLAYYVTAWSMVGKDLPRGTIIPRYEPPHGMSPATMRYLRRMGYDNKVLAATLIDMAARGYLTLHKYSNNYEIIRTDADSQNTNPQAVPPSPEPNDSQPDGNWGQSAVQTETPATPKTSAVKLSSEEQALADDLLGSGNAFFFSQANYSQVQTAISNLRQKLRDRFENYYFVTNKGFMATGIILSLLAAALMVSLVYRGVASAVDASGGSAVGMLIFTSIFSGVGWLLFLAMAVPRWRIAFATTG